MPTVRFSGTRADVTRIALQLAQVLAGKAPDTLGIARGFNLSLGFAVLSDVKDAFVTKAQGGTDEAGIRWPPLSPKTIANRRVGPGDTRSSALIRSRERIRRRETKKALARFRLSLPESEAQRRAKIVGGIKATQETGKTKLETLGSRQVEILRDTGVLLNSLSPGTLSAGGSYTAPSGDGGEQQIMSARPGELIVGTNVIYASTHHRGDRSRNIPARPFWPEEGSLPQVWWDRWLDVANRALVAAAAILYQRST